MAKTTIIWNGIKYLSINKASVAIGVGYGTMLSRIKKGYTCDADIKTPGAPLKNVTWNSVHYASVTEAAKKNGITRGGMTLRLRRGYTCDSDMKRGPNKVIKEPE